MTRRVFVSALHTGLTAVTTKVSGARASFTPSVDFRQELPADEGGSSKHTFAGSEFSVVGPGDVTGFDAGVVIRCEPPPGTVDAVENNLVTVDFRDARLPWLLNLPGMADRPWLTLVVLREDEADLVSGDPLPLVSAPAAALPDPDDLASWAHVEVRLEPGEDLAAVLTTESRTGTDRVVARLVCPRRLAENAGWLACLVPTTRAGAAAGQGRRPADGEADQPAWRAGGSATLPVYFSWRFRTGPAGSFEDLATLVRPVDASDVEGLGSRTIDVRHPWPHQDPPEGSPAEVTLDIQGVLRVPGEAVVTEVWTDAGAQQRYRDQLRALLDAPGQLAEERDQGAVAPPLYGSHHTGHRAVPGTGWMEQLNLEARHRIAASLGGRYVQVEQEFLMERAWEQVGEVREANRRIAVAELAAEAATRAQAKHLAPMEATPLTMLADPIRRQVRPDGTTTLAALLSRSAVPDGTASSGFRRLARPGGAMARRARRAGALAAGAGAEMAGPPMLQQALAGSSVVPLQPMAWLTAGAAVEPPTVAVDTSTTYGTATMVGLLDAQAMLVGAREDFAGDRPGQLLTAAKRGMGGAMGVVAAAAPTAVSLRRVRQAVAMQAVTALPSVQVTTMALQAVAGSVRSSLASMPQLLERVARQVVTAEMTSRTAAQPRPLRPLMKHPSFGFPIGAELLTRWPEWAVPGITEFPENRCTLLETNPQFVEAALVGLNQEFNRELLWREYPTDQAGTPFARFWPGGAPFGEIALWGDGGALGSHDATGGASHLTFLIRAEVLRRYPGSLLLAVRADAQKRVPETGGTWKQPLFTLPVDDRTCVYGFDLTRRQAEDELWLFVLREPMRGTQFGFDRPTTPPQPLEFWADLSWQDVPVKRGFAHAGGTPPRKPSRLTPADPRWGTPAVDIAHIAFQRPFQVAYSPARLLE